MEDGGGEAQLVEAELGDGVLGDVLRGEAHDDRAGDEAEDEALAEGGVLHGVLVEVRLRGVHDELREELVLELADGSAAGVLEAVADGEVLEVVRASGQ